MTYDFNNIETMLREGVPAEEIAKHFTDSLNSAITAANKPTHTQELCSNLAEAWNGLVEDWTFYHNLPAGLTMDDLLLEGDHVEELFNYIMELIVKTAPLLDALNALIEEEDSAPSVKPNTAAKHTDNFDSVMRSFLNSIK